MRTCKQCGNTIPPRNGPGRRKEYCGAACKDERRRNLRAFGALTESADRVRIKLPSTAVRYADSAVVYANT